MGLKSKTSNTFIKSKVPSIYLFRVCLSLVEMQYSLSPFTYKIVYASGQKMIV